MARYFVTPSTCNELDHLHVGIIMDGNGRWARARGLPRWAGHAAGVKAVRDVVRAAPELGIGALTLYAFSADNWKRPDAEVGVLMNLLSRYLREETGRCRRHGVRINVIGRRDRLAASVRRAIECAESATAGGRRLLLRLAVDYSGRDAIVGAARRLRRGDADQRAAFASALANATHAVPRPLSVDLVIRTGGEQRLSDFLLYESAYAELHFTSTQWPDFGPADLRAAVEDFRNRDRRFGGLPGREIATQNGGTT